MYRELGVSVTQKKEIDLTPLISTPSDTIKAQLKLDPRSPTYGEDYINYIKNYSKYDSLRIVGGVQERPTDTPNLYTQKSTGVESTQCITCNLDPSLIDEYLSPTDYRELVREREALIEAGVSVDLDLRSAESMNSFKENLPVYRAEADEIKKQSRQQASPSVEVFRSYTSSPESNDTQPSLFGGNRQLIETEKSITTQEAISRDPLGSFTSIGSGIAIGVGVLALSYLLNKRK
jgi:hypothetical protein